MSKTSKRPRNLPKGRDLNVLYSLTGQGQKMTTKVMKDRKKQKKEKHRKDFGEDYENENP